MGCRLAWPPHKLGSHLLNSHQISVPNFQTQLDAIIEEYRIFPSPAAVILPPPDQAPVDAIKIHSGYRCNIPGCVYAARSEKTIRKHRCRPGTPKDFSLCHVQTLFYPIARTYFVVNISLANVVSASTFEHLVKYIFPQFDTPQITPISSKLDVPPHITIFGWSNHLSNFLHTDNRDAREHLLRDTASPDPKEIKLAGLSKTLTHYYDQGSVDVQATDLLVRRVLYQYPLYVYFSSPSTFLSHLRTRKPAQLTITPDGR